MFKKFSVLAVGAVAFLLLVSTVSAAADHLKLGSKGQINQKACDAEGKLVLDITQKVTNDVDSGFGSNTYFSSDANYWNVESYTRHLKVWPTGTNTWCAAVVYDGGHFNAFYGQTGPGGTGLISADVSGEMHGGYRATFTGTFAPGSFPTHGNIGTFDYKCDLHQVCSGYVDLYTRYFSGYTNFAQPWWGWIYNAGKHGTWLNEIDVPQASSGNIL